MHGGGFLVAYFAPQLFAKSYTGYLVVSVGRQIKTMSDQDTIIDTHRNNPPAQPQIPIQQCCVVSHIDLDCVVASKAYITAVHRAAEDLGYTRPPVENAS